jgi:hypothetical protein
MGFQLHWLKIYSMHYGKDKYNDGILQVRMLLLEPNC